MVKLTLQQLLAQAKKRQASRRKSSKKLKKIQEKVPEGEGSDLLSFAMNVAGDTRLTDAAQYAFTNRLLDEMVIRQLRNAPGPAQTRSTHPNPRIQKGLDEGRIAYDITGELQDADGIAEINRRIAADARHEKRARSDKQLMNDSIQSNAFAAANKKARKKDGTFKKGWDQRRVAMMAQKECTKERERLGLCERKSTRKGQVRKTARRAYKK